MKKLKINFKNYSFKSKKVVVILSILILTIFALVLSVSYSKFSSKIRGSKIYEAYFIPKFDVSIQIYKQQRDSSGWRISNAYDLVSFIPIEGYEYVSSKTKCTPGVTISSYDYVSGTFNINATSKGFCKVFFDAYSSYNAFDLTANTYVEQVDGAGDYILMPNLPTNHVYEINDFLTSCTNAAATLKNNEIVITQFGLNAKCDVYVDIVS